MSETYRQGFDIMNRAEMMFNKGCVEESLNNLVIELNELRKNSIKEQWQEFAATGFLKHQISELIHQDPFTNHSFIKPRNYSGDAELVDYMYRLREPDSTTTDFGKALFECTTNAPAPQSVRARKSIIASMIDELAESSNNLRIFSIACGHLREAFISEAVLSGRIEEFFALDQDPLSLEIVKNELSEFNVKPIHASIKSLFTNGHEFQNLDFI